MERVPVSALKWEMENQYLSWRDGVPVRPKAIEGSLNKAARLAGWRRVTQQG
jgi:hypothetical protein